MECDVRGANFSRGCGGAPNGGGRADNQWSPDRHPCYGSRPAKARCPRGLRQPCPLAAEIPATKTRCAAWDGSRPGFEIRNCCARRNTRAQPGRRCDESNVLPYCSIRDPQFVPPASASVEPASRGTWQACLLVVTTPRPREEPCDLHPMTGQFETDLQ